MEPVIIKYGGKREVAFFPDRLAIMKGNRVIETISHDEIEFATYNPKFNLKDLFFIIIQDPVAYRYMYNAFTVVLKSKRRTLMLRLSNDEYEKIKDTFKPHIGLV